MAAANGHHTMPQLVKERTATPVLHAEPSSLERITGSIKDNFSPAMERVEDGIRNHPKLAVVAGLSLGVLVALVVRRLR